MADKPEFVDAISEATQQSRREPNSRITPEHALKHTSRLSHWPSERMTQWRLENLTPWKVKSWKYKDWE